MRRREREMERERKIVLCTQEKQTPMITLLSTARVEYDKIKKESSTQLVYSLKKNH